MDCYVKWLQLDKRLQLTIKLLINPLVFNQLILFEFGKTTQFPKYPCVENLFKNFIFISISVFLQFLSLQPISGSHFYHYNPFQGAISGSHFREPFLGAISGSHFRDSFQEAISGSHFREPFQGAISGSHFWEPFQPFLRTIS